MLRRRVLYGNGKCFVSTSPIYCMSTCSGKLKVGFLFVTEEVILNETLNSPPSLRANPHLPALTASWSRAWRCSSLSRPPLVPARPRPWCRWPRKHVRWVLPSPRPQGTSRSGVNCPRGGTSAGTSRRTRSRQWTKSGSRAVPPKRQKKRAVWCFPYFGNSFEGNILKKFKRRFSYFL